MSKQSESHNPRPGERLLRFDPQPQRDWSLARPAAAALRTVRSEQNARSGVTVALLAGNRMIAVSVTDLITSMGWDCELIESSSLGPTTSTDWDLIVIATTDETYPIARICALASRDSRQHVLVISSNSDSQTIADALNSGADDYVIAPFDIDECRARMRVLVSRSDHASRPHSKLIWIEPMLRTVGIGSQHVTLSMREWSLLKILIDAGQQPVSAAMIEEQLWGGTGRQSTLASVVSRLRTRLEAHKLEGIEIATVRGVGYAIRFQGLDTSLLKQERRPGDRR
jgi:DNA-binding response OmpR family regulator